MASIVPIVAQDCSVEKSMSPSDFRAECAGGGGACAVEMGQEKMIALLLKQQEEVLQELRNQKQVHIDEDVEYLSAPSHSHIIYAAVRCAELKLNVV